MPYMSGDSKFTRALFVAKTCPYLVFEVHCAGGDYCRFPSGRKKHCCFFCNHFYSCPDKTGVCTHFQNM